MDASTPRQRYIKRLGALKSERSTWIDHWRELSEYVRPRKAKFFTTDTNNGAKQHRSIINGTPIRASRILASGMMAGISSPARPWFRLTTADAALAEYGPVKDWLHIVESVLREKLQKSNLYNCLHQVYENLIVFGTQPLHIEEDVRRGFRGYVFPVGQYCLANSAQLEVNTVYRELRMTVAQAVERFGLQRCSNRLRQLYERQELDQWVDVLHVLEPNRDAEPGRPGPRGMAWRSCWLEVSAAEGDGPTFLREGGFEEFPVMAPRWAVSGEDVYGESPGMEALGDAKALQLIEKRKAQAVDRVVNPPMRGPSALRGQQVSLLPGAVTYVDAIHPGQSFAPAIELHPSAIPAIDGLGREHELRINQAFMADLWMSLARADGKMTATEVMERHEEKMLQLGPVMERLQNELLDPMISRCFNIGLRNRWFPPPPEELQGQEARVEYLSIMAQAQKMLGITGVERFVSFVGSVAAGVGPDVLDKLDADQVVDEYGNMLGIPPSIVRPDEAVEAIRAKRAQVAQAQQAIATAGAVAEGAKTLSQADTGGDNALTRLMHGLSGVAAGGLPQ